MTLKITYNHPTMWVSLLYRNNSGYIEFVKMLKSKLFDLQNEIGERMMSETN